MSTWFLVVLAALLYVLYVMLQSYRSLERELREIRLKCMGTRESALATPDPATTIKDRLVGAFARAAELTAPRPLPELREALSAEVSAVAPPSARLRALAAGAGAGAGTKTI